MRLLPISAGLTRGKIVFVRPGQNKTSARLTRAAESKPARTNLIGAMPVVLVVGPLRAIGVAHAPLADLFRQPIRSDPDGRRVRLVRPVRFGGFQIEGGLVEKGAALAVGKSRDATSTCC
jgi:hypothetical protein